MLMVDKLQLSGVGYELLCFCCKCAFMMKFLCGHLQTFTAMQISVSWDADVKRATAEIGFKRCNVDRCLPFSLIGTVTGSVIATNDRHSQRQCDVPLFLHFSLHRERDRGKDGERVEERAIKWITSASIDSRVCVLMMCSLHCPALRRTIQPPVFDFQRRFDLHGIEARSERPRGVTWRTCHWSFLLSNLLSGRSKGLGYDFPLSSVVNFVNIC